MWVSMSVIRDIVYGAAGYGVPVETICSGAGIRIQDLDDPSLKASFEQGHAVWKEALKLTGDEFLGLHLGANTTTSVIGMVGHLMQTSRTLLDAFQQLSHYTSVITEMFSYRAEHTGSHFIVYLEPSSFWKQHYTETACQATDQAIAGTLNVCKLLTGKNITPLIIEFTKPKPVNVSEYERVLNAPLSFNKLHCRVFFDASVARLPVLGYNEDLQAIFKKLADEALQNANRAPSFSNRLKQTITRQFYNRIPALDEVGSYMGITGRTLQRRLTAEGTSFHKVTEELRKEMAVRLLSVNKYTVNETAYLLGYAEPSAFRRAFKRWTGKNPGKVK